VLFGLSMIVAVAALIAMIKQDEERASRARARAEMYYQILKSNQEYLHRMRDRVNFAFKYGVVYDGGVPRGFAEEFEAQGVDETVGGRRLLGGV
jgi:hypothetical protein